MQHYLTLYRYILLFLGGYGIFSFSTLSGQTLMVQPGDTTICANSVLGLNAVVTNLGANDTIGDYSWSYTGTPATGLLGPSVTDTNTFNIGQTAGAGNSYTITCKVPITNTTSIQVDTLRDTITVNIPLNAPSRTLSVSANAVCTGYDLDVNLSGSPVIGCIDSIRWRVGNGGAWNDVQVGLNDSSITIQNLQAVGTYDFQTRSVCLCDSTDWSFNGGSNLLTVSPQPTLSLLLPVQDTVIICAGDSVDFEAMGTDGVDCEYIWRRGENNGPLSNLNIDSSIFNSGPLDTGSYRFQCRYRCDSTCDLANSRTVQVIVLPTDISAGAITKLSPQVDTACAGADLSVAINNAEVGCSDSIRYRVGTSGPWLAYSLGGAITASATGEYYFQTQRTCPCGVSGWTPIDDGQFLWTIVPAPSVTINNFGASAVCDGTEVTLQAEAIGGTGCGLDWQEEIGGNYVSLNQSGATLNITPEIGTHTYRCVYTCDQEDCSEVFSNTIEVVVDPIPVGIPIDTTVCSNTPLNLVLTSQVEATYTWSRPGNIASAVSSLIDTVENSSEVPITVVYVIIPTGIGDAQCEGTPFSVTVVANPAPSFPTITATQDQVCIGSKNVTLSTPLQEGTDLFWSLPTSYEFTRQGSPNIIFSVPDNATPGIETVQVTATNELGCTLGAEQIITISPSLAPALPEVILSSSPNGTDVLVCLDNTFSFYQWGYDNEPDLESTELSGEIYQDYLAGTDFTLTERYYWVRLSDGICETRAYYIDPPERRPAPESFIHRIEDIQVAPNPNHGVFSIYLGNRIPIRSSWTIELWDTFGKRILAQEITKSQAVETVTIDQRDLAQGIYYLRVVSATSPTSTMIKLMISTP